MRLYVHKVESWMVDSLRGTARESKYLWVTVIALHNCNSLVPLAFAYVLITPILFDKYVMLDTVDAFSR